MKNLVGAAFGAFLASGLAAVVACSSSSSGGSSACNTNPFSCPAGTTCWVADSALDVQCLPSLTTAKLGDPCMNATGHPTCGDGMMCLQDSKVDTTGGVCTAFCDSSHPCTAPATCQPAQLRNGNVFGPILDICFAGFVSPDGGMPPPPRDAGASDAGVDASDAAPPPVDASTSDAAGD